MKKINVEIYWEDHNYCCGWSNPYFGAVICTAKDIETLKFEFENELSGQIDSMLLENEELPKWLAEKQFLVQYSLSVSAVLRLAEKFTTLAAIGQASGINYKLLCHYASGKKKPREKQRQRIVQGIRQIGNYLETINS